MLQRVSAVAKSESRVVGLPPTELVGEQVVQASPFCSTADRSGLIGCESAQILLDEQDLIAPDPDKVADEPQPSIAVNAV